jgi:hypothetical protein
MSCLPPVIPAKAPIKDKLGDHRFRGDEQSMST